MNQTAPASEVPAPKNGNKTGQDQGDGCKPPPLQIEVYKALATLFNSEETSFWTRNNILVAVQGFLIAATASMVGNAEKALGVGASVKSATLFFVSLAAVALVGLAMAVAWIYMVGRSERIANTISTELKEVEARFELDYDFKAFQKFGDRLGGSAATDYPEITRYNKIRLSVLWAYLGRGLAALWTVLLLGFVGALLSGYAVPEAAPVSRPSAEQLALVEAAQRTAAAAELSASSAHTAMLLAGKALAAASADRSASSVRGCRRGRRSCQR